VICAAPLDLCARGDWGAVRGAAADRGRRQCGLAALLVVDHQRVVDDGACAEPQDAAASTALCLLLGVPMALVLARDGRSAVLMSHDLLNVLTLADRVLVLETGQIIETVAGSVCGSPG
jgi:ABC-type cobalamin transport system ATPase subunit